MPNTTVSSPTDRLSLANRNGDHGLTSGQK
jgi:hypothetical protein